MAKILLLVEDEDFLRETCKEYCEGKGFTVIEAANAIEGLEKLIASFARDARVGPVDIVLSDNDMPNKNQGLALLEMIRGSRVFADVPFILTSGRQPDPDAMERIKELDAHFLGKPARMSALMELIGKLLPEK